MKSLSIREQKALSLLKVNGVLEPSLSDWRQALRIVDNCASVNAFVKAKEYKGNYSLAKQDLCKYTPVLSCGAQEQQEADMLTQWLLKQPNAGRKQVG